MHTWFLSVMNKNALEIFSEGTALFASEFFWEAIEKFELVVESKSREYADDAMLNQAICYMRLGLYQEAKDKFLPVYKMEIGDNSFEGADEIIGTPSERATLGLFRIALAESDLDSAERYLDELRAVQASGVESEGTFSSFYEIASEEFCTATKK